MTAHPIDGEAFLWLDRLDDAVKHRAYDCTCQVGGVDAMSIDTDWLRHALSELRRAHRNMSERVGVAEHRATRAEAQSAIRGRAAAKSWGRAREAEAERDAARRQYDEDTAYWIAATDSAEARIKAVEDVLDRWQVDGRDPLVPGGSIRRALDA